jgi:hypothetical protein
MVGHAYNPSYSGARGGSITVQGQPCKKKKKKIVRSCLKKQTKSKGLGHSSSGKALA